MRGITRYGAVATKIRGMRSHLLTIDDYTKLAGSQGVREVAVFLKSHPSYGPVLEDLDPDNMRRETFERMILRSVFRDFAKISCFLDREHKNLLTVYSTQYELRLINNAIREIFNKYDEHIDLSVYKPMYENSPNFDFDKVVAASTMEELDQALEGSEYYEPVHRVRTSMDKPELFDYETSISRFYFSYFWEALKKINDKEDRETLMNIHGTEIDMLNLMWVYRAKAYYKISTREIYNFLIPAYHLLKPRQVAEMVAAAGPAEVLNLIAATRYGRYIDLQDPSSLERAYAEHISKLNAKTRKENPYSFAVIGAYAYDKKAEVDNIVRITESVRYGYDPKLIISALNIRGNN